jgi:gas vesicle protein
MHTWLFGLVAALVTGGVLGLFAALLWADKLAERLRRRGP